MKYYSLHFGALTALFFFLYTTAMANPANSTGGFNTVPAFIENKGQIADQYYHSRKDIDFKLQGNSMTMFVGDAQLHYQWYRSNKKEKSRNEKAGLQGDSKSPSGDLGVAVYRMDVVLLGANKNAEVIKEGLQEDYENYYLPQCPDGVTAHRYSKITYKNVYPNIDWEIETAPKGEAGSQGCKYNFIVHPGGDYRDIKIQYNGATSIALKDGALVANTPMGSITENVPYTYDAATHKEIKSNFILSNNILSYNIALPSGSGEGEATPAFVIDPILKWGTYYGGGGERAGHTADDSSGNVYLLMRTSSTNNIATTGAYQTTVNNWDAGLALFDINGVRQWGTYYGGAGIEDAFAVTCDNTGNVYIGGTTNSSSGMAGTGGSFQTAAGPGYLAKFNSLGQLQWNSYFNGEILCMAYDGAGYIYFAGNTGLTSGIGTTGTYQPSAPTNGGGFLEKFSLSGSQVWGSFYAATVAQSGSQTYISSVSSDRLGNVFIGGHTGAQTGIASPGAFISTLSPGNYSNFLACFTASGTRQWGTYYNVLTGNYGLFVAADGQGSVYAAGTTMSTTGMATSGAYLTTIPATGSAFLAKFNNSGGRVWGTYYGGTGGAAIYNIATHANGDVYLTGAAAGNNGIATPGAYQTTAQGLNDAFIAAFSSDGSRLKWGTFYGGTAMEYYGPTFENWGLSLTNKLSRIYFAGVTNSYNGIATPLAHQTTYTGSPWNAFLVQFQLTDTQVYIQPPFIDTVLCVGDTLHINYGVTYNFRSGNVFTVQLSNAAGSFASPVLVGTINASVGGSAKFALPNLPAGTGYRVRIISSLPADTSDDNGKDMRVSPYPTTPVATANSPLCSGLTLNLNSSNSSTGVVWSWIGPNSFTAATQNASIPNVQTNGTGDYIVTANLNGCKRKDTVSVTVNQTPSKPNATSNSPICSGQTLNLFATSTTGGVSWNWVGPGGFNPSTQNPTIPNAQTSNAGSYVVTATLGNCSSSDTEVVVINQGPAVNVYPSPNDTICQGGSVTLVALPVSAGTGPTFQWYKNSNPIGGATNTSYSTTPNNGDVFYCQMTPGTGTSCTGAINSNSITMTVLPVTMPSVSISGPAGAQDPYNLLTFHATDTGGGSNPKYQWLRSGQLVQGATSDTWSTQGLYLSQHDTICVILTSSDICAVPKSDTACMVVNILTGVEDINKNTTIQLYPNPNDGRFTIDAKGISSKEVTIEITNAVGQTVHTQKLNTTKGILHETISTNNLSAGIYLLKLHDGDAMVTLRLVVSR